MGKHINAQLLKLFIHYNYLGHLTMSCLPIATRDRKKINAAYALVIQSIRLEKNYACVNERLKNQSIRTSSGRQMSFETLEILGREDNFSINRRHLANFINRYKTTGEIAACPKRGPMSHNVTPQVLDFMDCKLEENDEITVPNLVRILSTELQLDFSVSKVKRLCKKLG